MQSISVSLALASLKEATEEVEKNKQLLKDSRADRDGLIRSMLSSGVKPTRLSRFTGLSMVTLRLINKKDS